MLLSELVNQAIAAKPTPPLSEATVKQYQSSIIKLMQFLGDQKLAAISTNDIVSWCDWLHIQPHIRTTTGNSYRRSIRSLLRRIGRPDLAAGITIRTEPRPANKAISEDDFARLLAVANMRDTAILLLLAESGCRRGAIPRLKNSDVAIAQINGEYRVAACTVQKGTNGGRPLTVFAGHKTGVALHRWLAKRPDPGAEYLFTRLRDGQPLKLSSISDILHRLKKRAGIPKSHFVCCHAFRHRFAKVQLSKHHLKMVSELMGHSSVRITERYVTYTDDDLARAFFGDDLFRLPFNE